MALELSLEEADTHLKIFHFNEFEPFPAIQVVARNNPAVKICPNLLGCKTPIVRKY